jgi:hypothetical protein
MAVTIQLNKPYCTLLQLQKELKNTDADDEDAIKDWHHDCINRASRLIDEYCQRDFWFHDHSSTVLEVPARQVHGRRIDLDSPIITLTEIVIDGDVIHVDDYRFNVGDMAITYLAHVPFIDYEANTWLTLKGTFGYTIASSTQPPTDAKFPEGVRRACIIMAAAMTGDLRKEVQALDGTKVSLLDTSIPKEAKSFLQRHRRRFL